MDELLNDFVLDKLRDAKNAQTFWVTDNILSPASEVEEQVTNSLLREGDM